ncbi:hypothetical protein HYFRA_00006363 [Hymenoscyphus fraxineus]|uniref:Peptide hydrolase n=1 Tax=Hymenoscyphus fraxineus TaxID=746836 RepID=A0A9N9KPI5_9HELO|nr:hypothetical protein HYFRA_00006363 [Hymenoscyphus fraxineus]
MNMFWPLVAGGLLQLAAALTPLSDESLRKLPAAGGDFDIKTGAILAPILIPRVPGTPGSKQVQEHFRDWFATNLPKWKVEYQNSTATTPATGTDQVPFVNIIVTRDPPWAKPGNVGRLALVAHYDSKLTPTGFIGAIDSAAPCAMIMHAARSIDEAMTRKWEAMEEAGEEGLGEDTGIQIILLDGEEAFVNWTDDDSLYGSRSLAEEWEATIQPAMSTYQNALRSISLFLLLDLLGSKDPIVPSYFATTHWAYRHMSSIESRIRKLDLTKSDKGSKPFLPDFDKEASKFGIGGIADDHLPFMARGVEILHIIPSPFPRVWHTLEDDGEHLDMSTVEDWTRIVTAFAAEWLDLEGHFPDIGIVGVNEPQEPKRSAPIEKTEL